MISVVGWFVTLGGLGALSNNHCSTVSEGITSISYCIDAQNTYRYAWFILFYEFFAILGLLICIANSSLAEYKFVLLAFQTLAASQTMPQAEYFINAWNGCKNSSGSVSDAVSCPGDNFKTNASAAACGFVLLSLVSIIWIVIVGSAEGSKVAEHMPTAGRELQERGLPIRKSSLDSSRPAAACEVEIPTNQHTTGIKA